MERPKGEGVRIALPIAIQVLVVVAGGLGIYFQTTSSLRAEIQGVKYEVINKVEKSESKIEAIQDDITEIKTSQAKAEERFEKDTIDKVNRGITEHRLDCHSKASTKCDPTP